LFKTPGGSDGNIQINSPPGVDYLRPEDAQGSSAKIFRRFLRDNPGFFGCGDADGTESWQSQIPSLVPAADADFITPNLSLERPSQPRLCPKNGSCCPKTAPHPDPTRHRDGRGPASRHTGTRARPRGNGLVRRRRRAVTRGRGTKETGFPRLLGITFFGRNLAGRMAGGVRVSRRESAPKAAPGRRARTSPSPRPPASPQPPPRP